MFWCTGSFRETSIWNVFYWAKFTVFYILADSKGLSRDEWAIIYQHLSHFLLLRASTNTCSLTLNFRLRACLSSAMINSHRALRCLQELGAPYRTRTLFLMHNFLMSNWEMLPADVVTSSENQPWYWWQVPNRNRFWFIKCWSNIRS